MASVVALIWKDCEHCKRFKSELESPASKITRADISLCEKDDTQCMPNVDHTVSGYPTFKCVNKPGVSPLVGFTEQGLVDFIAKCK